MPKITVEVDPSLCILAATCVGIEPKIFQIGGEAHVEIADSSGELQGTKCTFEAGPEEMESTRQAAESCPTGAIRVTPAV